MTFLQRASNFFIDLYMHFFYRDRSFEMIQPLFAKKFGPNFPGVKQLVRNVSLIFVNGNEFFEMPKPTSNKVVYIGGILESKTKGLDKVFCPGNGGIPL